MSTNQVWRIGGKTYNWTQLQELKKKQLDPKTAQIEFKGPKLNLKKSDFSLPSNFMQLKALAKEKGMVVTKDTLKPDILKFLDKK